MDKHEELMEKLKGKLAELSSCRDNLTGDPNKIKEVLPVIRRLKDEIQAISRQIKQVNMDKPRHGPMSYPGGDFGALLDNENIKINTGMARLRENPY